MSIKTDAVHAVGVHRAVIGTPHAAVLRTSRGRHKSVNAFAARLTIHDFTERVGAARVLARIDATMLVANGMHRAVLGTGAVSLRLATVYVRITHVIWRAFAHWIVRRTDDAERCRMAGVRMTCLQSDALDIGHRVRAEPRWALTDRFVIVRNANRVHATRILVTGVVAGVRESVAELGRWTIDVIDAGHCAAPGRRIVRIAGILPRWTFAVRHVVVDDTKCVGTACDKVADQLASKRTIRGTATRLIFRALAVGGATVLARTVATPTIIRIAGVTRQTLAVTVMVLRHAAGIRGAGETVAKRHALQHAECIRSAALARVAVVVAYTVGHRWLLAGRQYRIPLVAVLTFASGVTRYDVGFALLIGAAHYFAARIYAVAHAAVQSDAEGTWRTIRVVCTSGYHGLGRLATVD